MSFAQIARQLGVTRNKVGGKLSRMGLVGRKTGAKPGVSSSRPSRIRRASSPPSAVSDTPRPARQFKPNRNTIAASQPRNYVNPTKSELYEMLRKAVENTK